MKRPFNVFDALFITALVFKLKGWAPVTTWFDVFSPYIVEAVSGIAWALMLLFSVPARLKFLYWKVAMKMRVKSAAKVAATSIASWDKFYSDAFKKAADIKNGSNPGQFVDKDNIGK